MVRLRLTRMGSINKPFYRVVAVDSRARRDGKYLDNVGYYDPKHNPSVIKIDAEKAIKWLKVGAQPSETVKSLFRKAGILKQWHELRYVKKEKDSELVVKEAIPEVLEVQEPSKPKKTRAKKEKITDPEPELKAVQEKHEKVKETEEVVLLADEAAIEAIVETTIEQPELIVENVEETETQQSNEEVTEEIAPIAESAEPIVDEGKDPETGQSQDEPETEEKN